MSEQFSDNKMPHQGEFQSFHQPSDKKCLNFNAPPDFRGCRFNQPNPGNSCHQHSMPDIPLPNYSNISSLSQLPPTSLPPPPLPPQLCATNFNVRNRLTHENYTRPPPSNHPPPRPQFYTAAPPSNHAPQRPQFYTAAEFPPSLRQPNLQISVHSKPPPPFPYPPPQGLIRQPVCEVKKQLQPIAIQIPSVNAINSNKAENAPIRVIPSEANNEDKLWVHNWMTNVKKRLCVEETTKKTKDVKINDVQKKILLYASLIKKLKDLLTNISALSPNSDSIEQKEILVQKAQKLKVKIEELKGYFNEKNVRKIKELLQKRREKRLKRRKTKGQRSEKRRKRKEEWKKMEEEMDSVIKKENEEEKRKLEEEKMKREADIVLREVRSKQEDVVRMEKLLKALTDLRDLRKKKGEIHGYIENPKASAFFDKMKREFETVLSDQQKLYHTEEQTLKIMIEESQSSTIFSKKSGSKFVPNLNEVKNDIYQIYFGKKRERSEAEKEYERSFLAAEESAEILVQRRKDWDQFIVGDNNFGSSIPIGWVLPNLNPCSDWKSYQEFQECGGTNKL